MSRQANWRRFNHQQAIRSGSPAQSLTIQSACPLKDEGGDMKLVRTFPFLRLPSELRNKIYDLAFAAAPSVIDLDPVTFKLFHHLLIFALFGVCRQLQQEATHYFFSTRTFRIFPTYPGKYFKTKKPLLARLPARYRESIASLELRLGPGWNNPPRGWIVNDALGLADCKRTRVLKVFVECDPSDGVFKGFRKHEGFYEKFSAKLLEAILNSVPSIRVVEFDAYSSVNRAGNMMTGLGEVVTKHEDKVVAWGPERGWAQESDQVWLDAVLMHGCGQRMSKSLVVFSRDDLIV